MRSPGRPRQSPVWASCAVDPDFDDIAEFVSNATKKIAAGEYLSTETDVGDGTKVDKLERPIDG